jgi:gliding motility-associated lipoprotein GldK
MSDHEVTQSEYESIKGVNPSYFKDKNRPVENVNWQEAIDYCVRLTKREQGLGLITTQQSYRLPTESEWEYAARGGLDHGMYPWGGPYTKNDRGCFLANFKPNRGDYAADQSLYTVEAKSFEPNGYNLYNMAGNVAEWTDSSYDAGAYEYVSSMNPNVPDSKNMRKVVRGGSWKDIGYFLQNSASSFEYQDTSKSYIGFRCITKYQGRDIKDRR